MPRDPDPPPPLPAPRDRAQAERLAERFAALGPGEAALAADPAGAALLAALGGHSPYLSDLALRESATLLRVAERGPDEAFALALDPLSRADAGADRAAVAHLLRGAKRRAALVAAVADLSGRWLLDRVTGALSDLAEAALDYACAHLLTEAAARGDLALPHGPAGGGAGGRGRHDPRALCRGSGLIVLGMGKLGGRELNYSSDIDLMLLYDPDAAVVDRDRAGACYVRLARDLVRLLEERTADGYVFRTDLRLRPDPAATPLAVSVPAAIGYYESLGQNWERAAMIKARPVSGDRAAGEAFLREIRPFVWRRHLDFAAIADIHAIKRQIHTHHARSGAGETVAVAGHDVKLGRGGIREIEFTAQVLQLIWGGRDPALRDPTTLGALAALAGCGLLDRRAAADLADAYVFLRTVEHRLQMVADRQTHRIPEDAAGVALVASFAGFADAAAFEAALRGHLLRVERHYAGQFEAAPALSAACPDGVGGNLVFTGPDDDPDTLETLRRMGFGAPAGAASLVRGWHHGRPRATRSARARELLTELMPALLAAFGRQVQPDAALARFDALLGRLPAGVQVLSLLHRNPAMLDRVAGILGAAPALADHLARNVAALDGLLAEAGPGADAAANLPALVREARHLDEALDVARRLAVTRQFEVDAAVLEGALDPDAAGLARSRLADAAIAALLPRVAAEFAARHGRVAGGGLMVMALGKLGGREMLPGSDLDLVLVYDHAGEAAESRGGERPLPAGTYYARLAHRVVAALNAPGAEGRLYDVDMRLRPSGSKGPVAVRLDAFRRYHAESAWTWERMALTRARAVAGPAPLRRAVAAAVREALTRRAPRGAPGGSGDAAGAGDPLADAAAMRARLARDHPPDGPWDVKHLAGGMMEVEFVAQALQLARAPERPQVLAQSTGTALARLARAGALTADEAATLIAADRLWRGVLAMMRLTLGHWREAEPPRPAAAALLRVAGPLCRPLSGSVPDDPAGLLAAMRETGLAVRAVFERRIGPLDPPASKGKP